MYHIKQLANTSDWEEFVKKQEYSLFVQSPRWGQFYAALGEQFWIIGIYQGKKLVGGSLVVSTHARRGNFLYLPYGPILDYSQKEMFSKFISYLKYFAKEGGYDFVRISPYIDDTKETQILFRQNGLRPSPMHVIAQYTWLLGLEGEEKKIFSEMKKNHRNLIRRCEREKIKIVQSSGIDALKRLNSMHTLVADRHNFARFPEEYITKEFHQFSDQNEAVVFEAILPNGDIDASAIIIFYGNMACYRHSASKNTDKKLPTSYLLQWEALQEAKKRGMTWYNFWGVEPKKSKKNHPFCGIGHFKRGFGGFSKNLLHCHDLPIRKKYWINWLVETIRRVRRGF